MFSERIHFALFFLRALSELYSRFFFCDFVIDFICDLQILVGVTIFRPLHLICVTTSFVIIMCRPATVYAYARIQRMWVKGCRSTESVVV